MTIVRRYWMALSIVAANLVLAGFWYDRFPQRVPIHWNLEGLPNAWIAKPAGAFALPAFALVTVIVQIAGSARRVSPILVAAIAAFFLSMTALVTAAGTSAYLSVALGALLMIFGNYLGKTTRTFVMGIRTPWSLASDEVWSRTHRVAGWLYVLAGLITLVTGLRGDGLLVGVASAVAAGLTAAVYSHVVWRRLR